MPVNFIDIAPIFRCGGFIDAEHDTPTDLGDHGGSDSKKVRVQMVCRVAAIVSTSAAGLPTT